MRWLDELWRLETPETDRANPVLQSGGGRGAQHPDSAPAATGRDEMAHQHKTGIEWATHVLNPIVGCLNGCSYCYARKQAPRVAAMAAAARRKKDPDALECGLCRDFVPHFHPERLAGISEGERATRRRRVFLSSMADWWSDGVQREWRKEVVREMGETQVPFMGQPAVNYLVLTKRPERIDLRDLMCELWPQVRPAWLSGLWVGVSATNLREASARMEALAQAGVPGDRAFLSLEPLMDWPGTAWGIFCPSWVIVGPMTGRGATNPHLMHAARAIAGFRDAGVPVYVKPAASGVWPELPAEMLALREYPEGLGD